MCTMQCLRELTKQASTSAPKAAEEVLKDDVYMDDLITGTRTRQAAIDLQIDLSKLLNSAQFNLRKWRTSDPAILESLTELAKEDKLLIIDNQEAIKTLGLLWNSGKYFNMKFVYRSRLRSQREGYYRQSRNYTTRYVY